MKYFTLFVLQVCFACKTKPEITSERVSLAKSNISFIMPDSSFIYSKPILWQADFSNGEYGEAGAFYYRQDSTVSVYVYVTAYPNSTQNRAPWKIFASEKMQREMLLAKQHNIAVI